MIDFVINRVIILFIVKYCVRGYVYVLVIMIFMILMYIEIWYLFSVVIVVFMESVIVCNGRVKFMRNSVFIVGVYVSWSYCWLMNYVIIIRKKNSIVMESMFCMSLLNCLWINVGVCNWLIRCGSFICIVIVRIRLGVIKISDVRLKKLIWFVGILVVVSVRIGKLL